MRIFIRTYWPLFVFLSPVFAVVWWVHYSPRAELCESLGGKLAVEGTCWLATYIKPSEIKLPE